MGDFDSYENPDLETETIVLPCEKDDTDTAFAVKEALKRGFQDFLLVGVIGERLDHTLGNVSLLLMLDTQGKHAAAVMLLYVFYERSTYLTKEDLSCFKF